VGVDVALQATKREMQKKAQKKAQRNEQRNAQKKVQKKNCLKRCRYYPNVFLGNSLDRCVPNAKLKTLLISLFEREDVFEPHLEIPRDLEGKHCVGDKLAGLYRVYGLT
jgi:hypothetical protein